MKKEFVTYEIALELKQLGFNEPCLIWDYKDSDNVSNSTPIGMTNSRLLKEKYHVSWCAIPLWQQVIDWLESNYGLVVEVNKLRWKNSGYIYYVKQYNKRNNLCKAAGYESVQTKYDGYEIGILKAIEVIKRKH